jgi:hypothetical protein
MNYSSIIRDLINKLEAIAAQGDTHQADVLGSHDNERGTEDQPIMMPPQTQKLELLKKAVGVESQYDDEEDCGCDTGEDEIANLKRRAGINPAVIDGLGDELLD